MEASGVLLLQEAMWSPFDAIMQPEHETTMAQVVLASSANVPDESGQSLRLPLVPWISDGALRSCNGLLENDNSSSSNVVHQESESDLIHMTSPFDDLASCLTSDDKSSNGIGDWIIDLSENVATDQWQTVKPKRKHLASKDDISSKCSNKARVSANVTKTTDEELDASQDPNGRKRADKKPSAKSQSLYAKERRDRINKRLRILQNLVPNGSKVNISTMLEEAAHYVKFLQLQIKMLRSDELWMYAPIAYNGINVDLDLLWRNNNK